MKIALNLFLFLSVFLIWGDKSFSLTDNQISRICKKEKRYLICVKNLQEKKSELQKGNIIAIPVNPYKR
tara:strand:- start:295 stop:501 length:207 start_codon:yes stop_codon:yes gene_type:complete